MPTSLSNRPVVALTMGDPAGIGPEVILKALAKPAVRNLANYIIVGDAEALEKTASSLKRSCRTFFMRFGALPEGPEALREILGLTRKNSIFLCDLKNRPVASFKFGKENPACGRASVEYIKRAYELVESGAADCITTAPINKSAVKKAGFKFPGHTEYLASLAGVKKFVMMLVGGPLRVSLVTRHIPLEKVARHLTAENIADTIEITLCALRTDFNIRRPALGVCALNPHSGEGGIFGKEELRLIAPALRKFRKYNIVGPISADAVFYDAYRGRYDAVICLYHDQGLIPLKMIARDSGVNVTLGLGFTRTSPDHGTAFDIAGKNRADPRSMEGAIKLAVSMAMNRMRGRSFWCHPTSSAKTS